jgi:NitT/TauT family transport system substrate-binding protein
MRALKYILAATLAALPLVSTARAETNEVRFAQQFAFTYLHLNVMKNQKLVEKHAAALGIPDLKVTFAQFSGGDAMNDALISGAVDFVCGGAPGLLYLWDRTKGTQNEVRGVTALGYFELLLNTRSDRIKGIEDFRDNDKIALSAVKVSGQALILQMAAARKWGIENWERLDKFTFPLPPPDQAAGMLSNNPAFETSFASPPFTLMQLKNPAVRTILKSSDIVGNATSSVWWSSKRFHDANPKVYQAVINATKEAQAFIDKDLHTAVEYYVKDSGAKTSVDDVVAMLRTPGMGFHVAPDGFMVYAEFLNKVGRLKNKPASWKDLFWPEIHDLKGS